MQAGLGGGRSWAVMQIDPASPWGSSEIGVSPSALSQPGAPPAGLLLPVPQRKDTNFGKGTPFRQVLLEKADS